MTNANQQKSQGNKIKMIWPEHERQNLKEDFRNLCPKEQESIWIQETSWLNIEFQLSKISDF